MDIKESQGLKFIIKESSPYMPIKDKQDRHFPAVDKLDYNNYLVAVNEILDIQY